MTRTTISLVLVVCLVLSGCASLGGDTGNTSGKATTTTQTTVTTSAGGTTTADTTTADTTTADTTTADTTTTGTTTATTSTEEAWSEPKSPNTPLQNKIESDDGRRIESVTVVDETEASDGGYSDFDLQVTADTQMENIDPADHGDVVGEPYFLVYVGGSLDNGSRFTDTNGTLIERSDYVTQKTNGEYTVTVHPDGLEKANVKDGEIELTVLLMDKDSDWDDIYAVKTITIEYSSEK
ncbi:hypothetical protein [Haladaptatus sp. NG-WS-4]